MAGSNLLLLLRDIQAHPQTIFQKQYAVHEACHALWQAGESVDDPVIQNLHTIVMSAIPQLRNRTIEVTSLYLFAMALDVVRYNRDMAMKRLIDEVVKQENSEFDASSAFAMLFDLGWFKDFSLTKIKTSLEKIAPQYQANDDVALPVLLRVLRLLGLGTSKNIDWLRPIFTDVAVPWIQQCAAMDYMNSALAIENELYRGWMCLDETMDHYNNSYKLWGKAMEAAGLRKRQSLPLLKLAPREKPLIGIFVHNAIWLAHVTTLCHSLQGLKNTNYDIKVFFLHGKNADIAQQFAASGVECVFMDDFAVGKGTYDRLFLLREKCIAQGVSLMIWLCLNNMMGYAFGIGLAPRQVYWCMKHGTDAFELPDDYWISMNGPEQEIEFFNRRWRVIPTAYKPSVKPDASDVCALRETFPKDIKILGIICREEKLNSRPYLEAVAKIMASHPKTFFLYAGKGDLPSVIDFFKAHGLTDRVRYVGWVDPRLYAEIIDIYLDCWPARSGMTAFNAFEAGKPYVFCVGDTGNHAIINNHFFGMKMLEENGVYHLPDAVLDHTFDSAVGRTLLAGEGASRYVDIVARLLNDREFYEACCASSLVCSSYLSDSARVGHTLDAAILSQIGNTERKVA